MSRALVIIGALALVLGAGHQGSVLAQPATPAPSQPGEAIESRIVNVNGELIQLRDGTVVRVPTGLTAAADLREGRPVKLRYAVKDKQNVVTSIEFPEEGPGDTRK